MYKCHLNSRTIYFTICNSPLRCYCNSVQGRPAVVPTYGDINNGRVSKLAPNQRQYKYWPVAGWLRAVIDAAAAAWSALSQCQAGLDGRPAGRAILGSHSSLPPSSSAARGPIAHFSFVDTISEIFILKVSVTAEIARLTSTQRSL